MHSQQQKNSGALGDLSFTLMMQLMPVFFLAQDELAQREKTLLFIIKPLTLTCPNYSLQIKLVQTKTLPPLLLQISISCFIFLTKQSNAIATFKCQIYLQIGSNLTTLNSMQSYLTVNCYHVSFVALCLLCLKDLSR